MKKKMLIIALIALTVPFTLSAWDKLGHDITTMIAWDNMTRKAKKNISRYLEGHQDIVYYACWMDYMGYATKSGYSNEWFDHCVPINKDLEYAEGEWKGDALMATEIAMKRLGDGKYKNLDYSTVLLLIKHLVHFLPDMHCPAHAVYNYFPSNYMLEFRGEKMTFHSLWDSMTSYGPHSWSASEWCRYLGHCTKAEQDELVKGTPREWVTDIARSCIIAHDIIKPDTKITDPALYEGNLLVTKQLQKAGYRLAYVLNSIFDK